MSFSHLGQWLRSVCIVLTSPRWRSVSPSCGGKLEGMTVSRWAYTHIGRAEVEEGEVDEYARMGVPILD